MQNVILLTLLLVFVIAMLTLAFYKPQKEPYSGFRATGPRDKSSCWNHHLNAYAHCLQNGDFQGECWARAEPRLVACEFNKY